MPEKRSVLVPISLAELLDKISILELKCRKFTDQKKLNNVLAELTALETAMNTNIIFSDSLQVLFDDLRNVNETLWFLEIKIRKQMADGDLNKQFIETAQNIINSNERRAQIKNQINIITNSNIVDEKDYSGN